MKWLLIGFFGHALLDFIIYLGRKLRRYCSKCEYGEAVGNHSPCYGCYNGENFEKRRD